MAIIKIRTGTIDFKEEDTSVKLFNVLSYMGVWTLDSNNARHRKIHKVYFVIAWTHYFLFLLAQIYFTSTRFNDMAVVTEALCIEILSLVSFCKVLSYLHKSETVKNIQISLMSGIADAKITGEDFTSFEILQRLKQTISRIFKFLTASAIVCVTFLVISTFAANVRTLPAPYDLPFIDTMATPYFEIIFFMQVVTLYPAVMGVITVDVILLDFLLKIQWQYYILINKVKQVGTVAANVSDEERKSKKASCKRLQKATQAMKENVDYHKMMIG